MRAAGIFIILYIRREFEPLGVDHPHREPRTIASERHGSVGFHIDGVSMGQRHIGFTDLQVGLVEIDVHLRVLPLFDGRVESQIGIHEQLRHNDLVGFGHQRQLGLFLHLSGGGVQPDPHSQFMGRGVGGIGHHIILSHVRRYDKGQGVAVLTARRRVGGDRQRGAHRLGAHLGVLFVGPQAARPAQGVGHLAQFEHMGGVALFHPLDIGHDDLDHGGVPGQRGRSGLLPVCVDDLPVDKGGADFRSPHYGGLGVVPRRKFHHLLGRPVVAAHGGLYLGPHGRVGADQEQVPRPCRNIH